MPVCNMCMCNTHAFNVQVGEYKYLKHCRVNDACEAEKPCYIRKVINGDGLSPPDHTHRRTLCAKSNEGNFQILNVSSNELDLYQSQLYFQLKKYIFSYRINLF